MILNFMNYSRFMNSYSDKLNFKINFEEHSVMALDGSLPLIKWKLSSFTHKNIEDARWSEWHECREWLKMNHPELLL